MQISSKTKIDTCACNAKYDRGIEFENDKEIEFQNVLENKSIGT